MARSAHDVFHGDRPISPRVGRADEAPRVLRVPGRRPPGDDRVPGLQADGLAPARLLSPVRLRPVRLGGPPPGGNPPRLHRSGNGGAGRLRQAPDLRHRKALRAQAFLKDRRDRPGSPRGGEASPVYIPPGRRRFRGQAPLPARIQTMRILIAKPGLDGHDRGAKVVAPALRGAGFEVIYTGLKRTVAEIVQEAIQEDVDVIGLSILSGAHLTLCRQLMESLKAEKAQSIPVVVGGIIPQRDVPALRKLGVSEVFPMGTPLPAIVETLKKYAEGQMAAARGEA